MDANYQNGTTTIHGKESTFTYADGQKALSWFEDVIGEGTIFDTSRSTEAVGEKLRDGVYLCKLMKKWQPSLKTMIEKPNSDINCKRNIQTFLDDCMLCGVASEDLFELDDLYDRSNIDAVLKTILAIKNKFVNKTCDIPRGHLDTPHPFAEKKFRYGSEH